MKKVLTWYYNRKLIKNEKKLVKLKEDKTKILDQVMESETYKVAKKILEKFGNEGKKIVSVGQSTPMQSALVQNQALQLTGDLILSLSKREIEIRANKLIYFSLLKFVNENLRMFWLVLRHFTIYIIDCYHLSCYLYILKHFASSKTISSFL